MNVLIYRYQSICEPDIIHNLKKLQFQVDEETTFMKNKEEEDSYYIEALLKRLHEKEYLFVFSINYFPFVSMVCNSRRIPYISLIVDSPVVNLYSETLGNKYNYVFLFDRKLYEEFHEKNPQIYHIPLATDPERQTKLIQSTASSVLAKFTSDISFIGSTYQEKCPFNKVVLPEYEKGYAAAIIEAQLKVFGYNFIEDAISDDFVRTFMTHATGNCPDAENFSFYRAIAAQNYLSVKVAEQERLRLLKDLSDRFSVDIYTNSDTSSMKKIVNKGLANSLTEMSLIFHQSKINLNITARSIRSGLSLRIFDVLGAGGFLITNFQEELPQFFEIGEDLISFDSREQLPDLCEYYLQNPEERKRIALNGYNKIVRFHTWEIRLAQIIKTVFP